MVPRAGIEPARPLGRQILSLLCLPISPSGLWLRTLRRRTIYSRLGDRKSCRGRRTRAEQHCTVQMRKPLNLATQGLSDMAQRTGLEPATPGVTGRYSNRLNYRCLSVGLLSESQKIPIKITGTREGRNLRRPPTQVNTRALNSGRI